MPRELLHGFLPVVGFGHHLHVRLQADDPCEALAQEAMVVYDEETNGLGHGRTYSDGRGTVASTVVPRPGSLSMARRPRTRSARSRMLSRPRCSPADDAWSLGSGTKPWPLSSTRSTMLLGFDAERQSHLCRAPVLARVAHGLLGDPEQLDVQFVGAALETPFEREVGGHAAARACSRPDPSATAPGRAAASDCAAGPGSTRAPRAANGPPAAAAGAGRRGPRLWAGSSCVAMVSSSTPIAARLWSSVS